MSLPLFRFEKSRHFCELNIHERKAGRQIVHRSDTDYIYINSQIKLGNVLLALQNLNRKLQLIYLLMSGRFVVNKLRNKLHEWNTSHW